MPKPLQQKLEAEGKPYVFTFGFGHHQGPEKQFLANCYTIVIAVDEGKARKKLSDKRGLKWAGCYLTEDDAGVERFNLTYIPFNEVKPQEGPNL